MYNEYDIEHDIDDELLDVEPYEGDPDFDGSQADEDGAQDNDTDVPPGLGFLARATNAVHSWIETLHWYATHQFSSQIGFDPDGQCLKVCRTARNIPAKYGSAKVSQDATPEEFRVYKVENLRRGMVLYFDDPTDSNRFGHIVTMVGRVRGHARGDLDGVLVETNSVKSGELVIVRGTYFSEHWGDQFRFGATWLNGVELDIPDGKTRIEKFSNGGPHYDLNLLKDAAANGRDEAGRKLQRIEAQIKRLPDSPKLGRVRQFKEEWRATRRIDMTLLDESVKHGRVGLVKQVRDEIKRLINTLPDE